VTARHRVVFLVDVDNTLIDNDHITADLKRHLEREIGRERIGDLLGYDLATLLAAASPPKRPMATRA
jgi:hypothetical protein